MSAKPWRSVILLGKLCDIRWKRLAIIPAAHLAAKTLPEVEVSKTLPEVGVPEALPEVAIAPPAQRTAVALPKLRELTEIKALLAARLEVHVGLPDIGGAVDLLKGGIKGHVSCLL